MKTLKASQNLFISIPDAIDQKIDVNGKVWQFDYCSYSGPLWLKRDGTPRKCQSPKSKRVWQAFEQWLSGYRSKASNEGHQKNPA